MRKILCLIISVSLLLCGCKNAEVQPVINELTVGAEEHSVHTETTDVLVKDEASNIPEEVVEEKEPEKVKEEEVIEVEEKQPIIIPEIKPLEEGESVKIALSFDDGPSKYTEKILDIFANYGGKGTFFVIGDLIDGNEHILNRILNEGHQLGNHTWSHKKLTKLEAEEITNEILISKAKIFEATGFDCNVVRPPYGAFDDKVKSVCKELGMPIVNWSVDTLDWKTKDKDAICADVINGAKDGAIILCHDIYRTTVEAMEYVIPKFIEYGYELVTIEELLGELEPGVVHRKVKEVVAK